ncbi:MAG TPA: AAA family ATPase, partial [Solirubrobacterales bacterium]|nr:AAA family ATPase [Solirubrobacterales bacterium]
LDVALALVGDPELLFLDEPTTGFDPSARRHAWKVIANLRDLGKTVFLTTHYMDEAQALADRAAIIVQGKVVAEGSPEQLGGEGATTISFRLPPGAEPHELPPAVRAAARIDGGHGGEPALEAAVSLEVEDPVGPLRELTEWAGERGVGLPGLEVRKPSLEDVYLRLTADEEDA